MKQRTRLAQKQMPILRPIPIPTKGFKTWSRFKTWIFRARTFELMEDWYVSVPGHGVVFIPTGFIFDGASIPRAFWWVFSPVGLMFLPGLVHDFIYRSGCLLMVGSGGKLVAKRVTRKEADLAFSHLGTYLNDLQAVPKITWSALFIFGWLAWNKSKKKGNHNILIDGKSPTTEMLDALRATV